MGIKGAAEKAIRQGRYEIIKAERSRDGKLYEMKIDFPEAEIGIIYTMRICYGIQEPFAQLEIEYTPWITRNYPISVEYTQAECEAICEKYGTQTTKTI